LEGKQRNKAITTFGLGFAQTDLSKELKAHSLRMLLKTHIFSRRQTKEQSYNDIWAGLRPDRPFKRTEGTLSDDASEDSHIL
jgi:hypothetical protein